ncbi:solute carrier family 25 (mitochondrial carrier, Graves disease autoantigen), member 16, isoform CRA_a [Mus musculus]|nr:solute carrier family 25 (mitochondrial carrier, Graves disease autoantigen), member 16, isoform CRA_a [Mus musculus]
MAALVAAAALAAAEPAPAVPQAAGSGGPTSRRDFYWLRSFLAGGIAGCCAKTTVAPLDRVKVLLQAHNRHYKHLGVLSTLRAVPQKEGYLGLYKGNGAMMIRIFPYGAIQFMAFEHYKTFITTKLGVSGHVHRLMAGSMAGMTAVICTYPLDVVRVRLAFQVKGEHTYSGIIHAFKTIYAKEGGFPWILPRSDAYYIRNGSICRCLLFYLWYLEECWAFLCSCPAWPTFVRQPQCLSFENSHKPPLWWCCWSNSTDDILPI